MHELDGAPGGALGAAAEARQAVTGVWGLIHQLGRRWLQEHAHHWSLKRWSQEVDVDGNMLLLRRSSSTTERSCESQSTGEVMGWFRCWNGLVVCPSELSHTDSSSIVP